MGITGSACSPPIRFTGYVIAKKLDRTVISRIPSMPVVLVFMEPLLQFSPQSGRPLLKVGIIGTIPREFKKPFSGQRVLMLTEPISPTPARKRVRTHAPHPNGSLVTFEAETGKDRLLARVLQALDVCVQEYP